MGKVIRFPVEKARKQIIPTTHPDNKVGVFESVGEFYGDLQLALGYRTESEVHGRTTEKREKLGRNLVTASLLALGALATVYFGAQDNQSDSVGATMERTEYSCDISEQTVTWSPSPEQGWDHAILNPELVDGNMQKGDFCYWAVVSELRETYGDPQLGAEYQVPNQVTIQVVESTTTTVLG